MGTNEHQGHSPLPPDDPAEEEDLVHCLCIDLIDSTTAGLSVSTRQYRRFSRPLVRYLVRRHS